MPLTTINGQLPLLVINNLDHLIIRKSKMGDISKYFSRNEFTCNCGCGFSTVDIKLIEVLQTLRYKFNKPVTITSGCRCLEYNEVAQKTANSNYIPYSSKSKHMQGIAADIVVEMVSASDVYRYLDLVYSHTLGLGKYDEFTHIDVRSKKTRWRN